MVNKTRSKTLTKKSEVNNWQYPMGKSPTQWENQCLLNQESTPKNTNAYAEKKDLSIWTRQCVGNLHPEEVVKLIHWLDLMKSLKRRICRTAVTFENNCIFAGKVAHQ